jgi:hypothetical protein
VNEVNASVHQDRIISMMHLGGARVSP